MNAEFDSIIFDMDGTLWDAVALYAESWNIYFKLNRINLSVTKKFLDQLMGLEEDTYLLRVLPDFSVAERKSIYQEVIKIQYDLIEKKGGVIYEGVIEGLQKLSAQYPLFIVSNCPELTIHYFIKSNGIEAHFTDTLSHGENYKSKYENIREIISRNKLKKPVYVGDTKSDSIQCKMSGIPFIFMEYGFGTCNDYFLKFQSFKEFSTFML